LLPEERDMPSNVEIRQERPEDRAAVRGVNALAFEQSAEADLVEALHEAKAVTLSLVAVRGGQIVGHILFSPVRIQSPSGDFGAIGLGPMAVLPEHQGCGIGSRLVLAGMAELLLAGHEAVIVLGHPEFYPRFGFVPASTYGIRWEQEVPDEVFMALELKPGALQGCGGVVQYRPEFLEV
jgi:putative acetyltransferase